MLLPQSTTLTTLADIVAELQTLDESFIVYAAAAPDFVASSAAAVYAPSADGSPPSDAAQRGLRYFLDVSVAKEAVEVWRSWRGGRMPSPQEQVDALIYYAIHDAYLPVGGET